MQDVLVIREAKQQLPDAVKKILLEKHPTAFGYAVPYKGAVHNGSHYGDGDGADDLAATLKNAEETYKDDRIFYHFLQAGEDECNIESLQPFNILSDGTDGEDAKILLSVMVGGAFPKYAEVNKEGDTYTPAYHFTVSFLVPLINELWELADNKLPRLMELLAKKTQVDKITAELEGKSAVLFIPGEDKPKLIANAAVNGGTWAWGYMTNDLGIPAEGTAAPPPTVKKVLGMPAKAKAPELPAKEEEKKEGEKSPEEIYKEVLKRKEFFLSSGLLWAKPAAGDLKTARNWWTVNVGSIPKDPRLIYAGCATSELSANSPLRRFMMEKLEPKKAESEQGPAEPPAKIAETPPREQGGITLFIPKDQKESYLKGKGENKYPSTTIEELEATLASYPAASVQLGEQFSDMAMMSPQAFLRLPTHIKLALWHETRCQLLGLTAAPPEEKPAEVVEPPKKKILGVR